MEALTNAYFYGILLEASKEAFESIELRETFYTDEAMKDNKECIPSKESIEQLGTYISNNLIVNYQIERGINVGFLRFLDRQQLILEKSHLLDSNAFYKRCLDSLNIKLTEWNKEGKYRIVRGISDMGTPPDTLEFLEYMKRHIKHKALQSNDTPKPQQPNKLKAPLIAFFCYSVNDSGVNKKDPNESVKNYCQRICEYYKLPYTDRVRQNFHGSDVTKNRKEIENILLLLDTDTKNKIQNHLDSKKPPKQNLYA